MDSDYIFVAIGIVCGLLMVDFAFGSTESNDTDIGIVALKLAALFVGMYIAIFIQITIHEAGHLVFGLMELADKTAKVSD